MTNAKSKSSSHRVEVYQKQNGGEFLTARQRRQIAKQKLKRVAQNRRRAAKEQVSSE